MSHKSKRKKERMRKKREEQEILTMEDVEGVVEKDEAVDTIISETPTPQEEVVMQKNGEKSLTTVSDESMYNDAKTEVITKTLATESTAQREEKEPRKKEVEKPVTQKTVHHHGPQCSMRKKIKNLTSLSIILGGFVVGALFVDVAQLIAQRGFSAHGIDAAQVITYGDATWVRHNEPRVVVDVVTADTCVEECDVTDDLLLELRRFIPTLEAHSINASTPEGSAYAQQHNVTAVPALLFDQALVNTAFYREAKIMFLEGEDDMYRLDLDSLDVSQVSLGEEEILQSEVEVMQKSPEIE